MSEQVVERIAVGIFVSIIGLLGYVTAWALFAYITLR